MNGTTAITCAARGLLTFDEMLARVLIDACDDLVQCDRIARLAQANGHDVLLREIQQEFSRRCAAGEGMYRSDTTVPA